MIEQWAWQPLDDLCGERYENHDGECCPIDITRKAVERPQAGQGLGVIGEGLQPHCPCNNESKGDGITTCTRCGSSERLFYGLCDKCHSIMCAMRPAEDMDIGV